MLGAVELGRRLELSDRRPSPAMTATLCFTQARRKSHPLPSACLDPHSNLGEERSSRRTTGKAAARNLTGRARKRSRRLRLRTPKLRVPQGGAARGPRQPATSRRARARERKVSRKAAARPRPRFAVPLGTPARPHQTIMMAMTIGKCCPRGAGGAGGRSRGD